MTATTSIENDPQRRARSYVQSRPIAPETSSPEEVWRRDRRVRDAGFSDTRRSSRPIATIRWLAPCSTRIMSGSRHYCAADQRSRTFHHRPALASTAPRHSARAFTSQPSAGIGDRQYQYMIAWRSCANATGSVARVFGTQAQRSRSRKSLSSCSTACAPSLAHLMQIARDQQEDKHRNTSVVDLAGAVSVAHTLAANATRSQTYRYVHADTPGIQITQRSEKKVRPSRTLRAQSRRSSPSASTSRYRASCRHRRNTPWTRPSSPASIRSRR